MQLADLLKHEQPSYLKFCVTILDFPFGISRVCRNVIQDLELVGHDDVHLVSHLQIIYDVMACGHAHDMEVFFFISFQSYLLLQYNCLSQYMYVRICRLDLLFFHSEILHKVHT